MAKHEHDFRDGLDVCVGTVTPTDLARSASAAAATSAVIAASANQTAPKM